MLQSEAAVGQRITRAKNKIRGANIPLRVPPAELLPERAPHVLACIYSVFTEGYWSTAGPSAIRDELCDEGVRLGWRAVRADARLERDAHALAALVLLHDSRRATRVDASGALVPLEEQDRTRWDRGRIARGLDRLRLAEGADRPLSAAGGDRRGARHRTQLGRHRLAVDLRGLRPAHRRSATHRWRGRTGRWQSGFGTASTPGCLPWTRSPTIRDWRGRAPWHRSALTCCGGRGGARRPPTGIGRRWPATGPNPRRRSSGRRLAECEPR